MKLSPQVLISVPRRRFRRRLPHPRTPAGRPSASGARGTEARALPTAGSPRSGWRGRTTGRRRRRRRAQRAARCELDSSEAAGRLGGAQGAWPGAGHCGNGVEDRAGRARRRFEAETPVAKVGGGGLG